MEENLLAGGWRQPLELIRSWVVECGKEWEWLPQRWQQHFSRLEQNVAGMIQMKVVHQEYQKYIDNDPAAKDISIPFVESSLNALFSWAVLESSSSRTVAEGLLKKVALAHARQVQKNMLSEPDAVQQGVFDGIAVAFQRVFPKAQ